MQAKNKPRRRRRNKQDRVKPYERECFPAGTTGYTPIEVVKRISDRMKRDGVEVPHPSTILRAVGIKKS